MKTFDGDPVAAAATVGAPLGQREWTLLTRFLEELRFWNRRINLVSSAAEQDLWFRHVVDSLTLVPFLPDQAARVLDIGSGGGFPGIPLQIARPGIRVCLLESSRRKVSFLRHAARTLELSGLTVLSGRAEDLALDPLHLQGYAAVVSRAAMPLPDLLRLGAPFLAEGGRLIAMLGRRLSMDNHRLQEQGRACGLEGPEVRALDLPVTHDHRNLLLFSKVKCLSTAIFSL